MRNDEKLAEIYSKFQEFANNPDNNYWLEKDSIYYTLAEYYGSEYYCKETHGLIIVYAQFDYFGKDKYFLLNII